MDESGHLVAVASKLAFPVVETEPGASGDRLGHAVDLVAGQVEGGQLGNCCSLSGEEQDPAGVKQFDPTGPNWVGVARVSWFEDVGPADRSVTVAVGGYPNHPERDQVWIGGGGQQLIKSLTITATPAPRRVDPNDRCTFSPLAFDPGFKHLQFVGGDDVDQVDHVSVGRPFEVGHLGGFIARHGRTLLPATIPWVRAVIQRVSEAAVLVDDEIVGSIGEGLAVLVGVGPDDGEGDARALAEKIHGLRVFPDAEGKMNLSVADVGGSVLVVSQFTLLGEVRRGRRPSFTGAARPELAAPLVDLVVGRLSQLGVATATGVFGAKMTVQVVNQGPVTLVIDVVRGAVV